MLKLIKSNFNTSNDCIIVAVPLIIFMFMIGWYIGYCNDSVNNVQKLILAAVTLLVMGCGCLSAWLYMVKKTIAISHKIFVFDKDRIKALQGLVLSMPHGIGRLFLPILTAMSFYLFVYSMVLFLCGFFTTAFLNSMSLMFFAIGINLIVTFSTMLWIPEIVYGEKNPFKAFIISVKNVYKEFKRSLFLFLFISFIILVVAGLYFLLLLSPFWYFLILILQYYFMVYIVVLLFNYYETEFKN